MLSDLVGKGLPMYLPNGFILWNEFETYIREKEQKREKRGKKRGKKRNNYSINNLTL